MANVPLKLKFGLLSKLKIDVSFLNLQLEQFEIRDLIIVVMPAPDFASTVNDKRLLISKDKKQVTNEREHTDNVILHLLGNLGKLMKGKQMNKINKVSSLFSMF